MGRHAPADEQLVPNQADQRVDDWLKKLRIESLRDQYPLQLSRGQRQRTAIARTLAMKPDLLLMDEPFSALDAPTREDLQNFIITLHKESDLTYVIVTHDIEVAVVMGKKILILQKGCNQTAQMMDNACAGFTDQQHRKRRISYTFEGVAYLARCCADTCELRRATRALDRPLQPAVLTNRLHVCACTLDDE